MRQDPECARCGAPVRPPDVWRSDWRCDVHGAVVPLHAAVPPDATRLTAAAARSAVPAWLPWPLPSGWLVTGLRLAGDDRAPARAVAVACSGPALVGGPADLVIVAEEPGVGLGARYAGLPEPDPGPEITGVPADTKVKVGRHPTPVWELPGTPDDRTVYVGEAQAVWLWLVAWPPAAWTVVHDGLRLVDLRDPALELDLPTGAPTPRLAG